MSHSVSTPTAVKALATLVPGSFSRLPSAAARPSQIPTQADRRVRYDRADLKEFAEKIKMDGVIQPIVVRPLTVDPHPTYEMVAGERRWLASTMTQVPDIPAMVHNLTDEQAERWQILENIQLEDAIGYVGNPSSIFRDFYWVSPRERRCCRTVSSTINACKQRMPPEILAVRLDRVVDEASFIRQFARASYRGRRRAPAFAAGQDLGPHAKRYQLTTKPASMLTASRNSASATKMS
jgi:hypothetical protein